MRILYKVLQNLHLRNANRIFKKKKTEVQKIIGAKRKYYCKWCEKQIFDKIDVCQNHLNLKQC